MKHLTVAAAFGLLLATAVPVGAQQHSNPSTSEPAEWKRRWGYLAEVIDIPYVSLDENTLSDPDLRSVTTWAVPGEAIVTKVFKASTGEVVMSTETRWDASTGKLITPVSGTGAANVQTVQADGKIASVIEGPAGGTAVRATSWMTPDRRVHSEVEQNAGAGWKPYTSSMSAPASDANITGAVDAKQRAETAERVAAAAKRPAALKMLQATSGATADEIARFGILARLAGSTWAGSATSSKYGSTANALRFTWLPGRTAVKIESTSVGAPTVWTAAPAKSGEVVMKGGLEGSGVTETVVLHPVDEFSLASDWRKATGPYMGRMMVALLDTGIPAFAPDIADKKDLPSIEKALQVYRGLDLSLVTATAYDAIDAANRQAGDAMIHEFNVEQAAKLREERRARNEKWAQFLGATSAALSAVNDAYDETMAERAIQQTSAAMSSNPAVISGARGTTQGSGSIEAADGAADGTIVASRGEKTSGGRGAPLRFVLSIGLQPRAGDTTNPTCYSTVVTRSAPGPGWGTGQMSSDYKTTYANAKAEVDGMKSSFIAACRSASGRDVTSEGNFHWTWNETRDGDTQVANTHAQFREDVTVSL